MNGVKQEGIRRPRAQEPGASGDGGQGERMTRDRFVGETVAWINRRLAPPGTRVDPATPLFEGGLIDSIQILRLIAWTEAALGRRIPDEMIRMEHFRDVTTIAATFIREDNHVHR